MGVFRFSLVVLHQRVGVGLRCVLVGGFGLLLAPLGLAQTPATDQRKADQRQQRLAPAALFQSAVGKPLRNVRLPDYVEAPFGEVTLYVVYKQAGDEGVPVFLVNRSQEKIEFSSQDQNLCLKLEARMKDGTWARVQNHRSEASGAGLHSLSLRPGEHFRLWGYFPREGEIAAVRFRTWKGRALASNIGQGHYLPEDLAAARLDSLSLSPLPPSLVSVLSEPTRRLNLGPVGPERYAAALECLATFVESPRLRRDAERYRDSLPEASAARASIEGTLSRGWPDSADPLMLLKRVTTLVGDRDFVEDVDEVNLALSWSVIADLLESGLRESAPSELQDEWRTQISRIYRSALPLALEQESPSVLAAAVRVLRLSTLSNEYLRDRPLFEWLAYGKAALVKASADLLVQRGLAEELAQSSSHLPIEHQLLVLGSLARGGVMNADWQRAPRYPAGDEERQFWVRCAEVAPLQTVNSFYDWEGLSRGENPYPRILHEPLRAFLLNQVREDMEHTEALAASELAKAVRFVGGWRRGDDRGLFEALRGHPGFTLTYRKADKEGEERWLEVRRYRIREEAGEVLRWLGAESLPEVVTRVEVLLTESPEGWIK